MNNLGGNRNSRYATAMRSGPTRPERSSTIIPAHINSKTYMFISNIHVHLRTTDTGEAGTPLNDNLRLMKRRRCDSYTCLQNSFVQLLSEFAACLANVRCHFQLK